MTGLEPGSSGNGSDRTINCATTTAKFWNFYLQFYKRLVIANNNALTSHYKQFSSQHNRCVVINDCRALLRLPLWHKKQHQMASVKQK